MHEIDFLPAEYRQKRAQRRSKPWCLLVVGVFGTMIVFAALGQHRRRALLEDQLAEIGPQYNAVVQVGQDVKELNEKLDLAGADAELFTYLRYRWPRTQILDAIVAPLPEEITFERLEIRQESPARGLAGGHFSRTGREAEDQRLASLPVAARDLERLRDEFDHLQTVVTITGVTTQSAALHRYLGALSRVDLFSKAELEAIESDAGAPQLRFSVSLVVRPGYGQPGGPSPESVAPHERIDHAPTEPLPSA